MKATTLLKAQHKKAKAALKKLTKKRDDDVLDEVASELAAHMVVEETIFYPAVMKVKPDLVMESYEEHAIAQLALKRLLDVDGDGSIFTARAKAVFDLIDHHVEEEEEELFPKVEKAMDDDVLEALGKKMKARFEELVDKGHAAVLPKSPAQTTADPAAAKVAVRADAA
ncbi:MAG TPA: hemerythrin domain-containing protein [Polyangiaceae bacterium]